MADEQPAPPAPAPAEPPPAAPKPARSRWLTWVLLALLLFMLWWVFIRTPTLPDDVVAVDVEAVDGAK